MGRAGSTGPEGRRYSLARLASGPPASEFHAIVQGPCPGSQRVLHTHVLGRATGKLARRAGARPVTRLARGSCLPSRGAARFFFFF